MKSYDHKRIERKWQKEWAKEKLYETPDTAKGPAAAQAKAGKKDNFYFLTEFPYPSGNLHVGHWYAFAVPDILARKLRMEGKNVLYPIGFDAFGLPAENAAIKHKLNPRVWTLKNIAYMKKQIGSMGASFDWSREVITCAPEYYKWTQWLFLQFFKKGLAYQKETAVNWCPKDKTVLANEQVVNGRCERCDSEVEQRNMLQWNLKITDYADRLIDDFEPLDWPQQIKESQRNWIGRSEGAIISFQLSGASFQEKIEVFTTRPDTLFGVTYLVLAPEHLFVQKCCASQTCTNTKEIEEYVKKAAKKTELERIAEQKEKTGIKLEGVEAVNPATGEKIPIFIADYVLGHYGTGAIMAVPAHDERDNEFATKFGLPIRQVIAPVLKSTIGSDAVRENVPQKDRDAIMCIVKHWKKDEYLCIQWKNHPEIRSFVSGGIEKEEDPVEAGQREIREETGYTLAKFVRQIGNFSFVHFYHQIKETNVLARFRYLYFELQDGEQVPVAKEETDMHDVLWKKRNEVYDFLSLAERDTIWRGFEGIIKNDAYTKSGLLVNSDEFDRMDSEEAKKEIAEKYGRPKTTYKMRDWVVSRQRYWGVPIPVIHCEKCGAVPVPEKELPVILPEIDDYLPAGDGKSPLAKAREWVAVECPQCGGKAERETDTLDTFVDSSWYFLRYTDPKNEKEFAAKKKMANWMPVDLYSGGAEHTTMHLLYSRFWHKAMYDLGLVVDSEPYLRRMNRSLILGPDGQKMSKSRGNVVDPDAVVANLGADTVRMYLAFIGPYNEVSSYPWNPDGVVGVRRFLERVWRLGQLSAFSDQLSENTERLLHRTIRKVGEDIAALKFNTAISQLMIFLNTVEKEKGIGAKQWESFLKLLAPFAPHMAEELWQELGHDTSIHLERWPEYDEKLLRDEEVVIVVQIDGKARTQMVAAPDAAEADVRKLAEAAAAKWLEEREVARVIYVPNRLINLVLAK